MNSFSCLLFFFLQNLHYFQTWDHMCFDGLGRCRNRIKGQFLITLFGTLVALWDFLAEWQGSHQRWHAPQVRTPMEWCLVIGWGRESRGHRCKWTCTVFRTGGNVFLLLQQIYERGLPFCCIIRQLKAAGWRAILIFYLFYFFLIWLPFGVKVTIEILLKFICKR